MFDIKRFKAQMVLCGVTVKELSSKLGIDESTFYRKLKADGDFNRDEINRLITILKIERPEDIFFAEELA